MTVHATETMYAGDDWELRITLLQDTGEVFDLSFPHNLFWGLIDQIGVPVLSTSDVTITTVDAAAGKIQIIVPASATTRLLSGAHTDYLRIVFQNIVSTLSEGPIMVEADPFAPPPTMRRSMVMRSVAVAERVVTAAAIANRVVTAVAESTL